MRGATTQINRCNRLNMRTERFENLVLIGGILFFLTALIYELGSG